MNALITKLPDSVTDGNLLKLGDFVFHIKNAATATLRYLQTNLTNFKIVGEGHFTNSAGTEDLGKDYTLPSGQQYVYLSAGEYEVVINPKYSLNGIYFADSTEADIGEGFPDYDGFEGATFKSAKITQGGNALDICKLMFFTNIDVTGPNTSKKVVGDATKAVLEGRVRSIVSARQSFSLDLDQLSNTALTNLLVGGNTKVVGDIVNLAKSTGIGNISIFENTNVHGVLEDLLDGMYANGKVSGSIAINLVGTSVTYNGSAIAATKAASFTSSGWTVS